LQIDYSKKQQIIWHVYNATLFLQLVMIIMKHTKRTMKQTA